MWRREYDKDGNLISVREVWGRDATPEECERFRAFAKKWAADEPKRRKRDRETLARLIDKYWKNLGYKNRREVDKYLRKLLPSKLEDLGITGFKRKGK